MPEAVCDSRKSGVERNVLGRLLTLTYNYVSLNYYIKDVNVVYLRGEVRLSVNLSLSVRLRVSTTHNTGF